MTQALKVTYFFLLHLVKNTERLLKEYNFCTNCITSCSDRKEDNQEPF